jgi:hypothetical protein
MFDGVQTVTDFVAIIYILAMNFLVALLCNFAQQSQLHCTDKLKFFFP